MGRNIFLCRASLFPTTSILVFIVSFTSNIFVLKPSKGAPEFGATLNRTPSHSAKQAKLIRIVPEPYSPTFEVSRDFLFFNRIQKTGSENFVFLMTELGKRANFTHQRLWSSNTMRSKEMQVRNT